jgi:hypothetical protein
VVSWETVGKTDQGCSAVVIVAATQDGCPQVKLNPVTSFKRSAVHNSQAVETPRCPTTDKWIRKLWCICTMEYLFLSHRNNDMWFEGKWMQSEDIVLS